MANMLFKTKDNITPSGKARVYFTCHPEDFEKYFDKICEDIFKSHDCAIYYTEDMSAQFDENEKATDLESNNLFVVPVTFKLLSTENRAMEDVRFALEHHIPVLPLMMEGGLDSIYSLPEKFGELQYLSPFSTDSTEVSFEEKLKKYLESVLVSDEMANRIRAAFDAYIFLSYRKKDRKYANQLMRIIHNKPECRDIAIWYDEFLTPGESFRENIDKILADSKLFTLLVTPNLLEDHNFVMANEYPAAIRSGISIIPAEMEQTDHATLAEKYINLPEITNPYDDEAFRSRLANTLSSLAIKSNDSDPYHNFLIGLAYLDGIDVEVNRERALELITSAAEANLPEAMEKLADIYENGTGVTTDRTVSIKWLEKLTRLFLDTVPPENCNDTQFEHYRNIFSRLSFYYDFTGRKTDYFAIKEQIFEYSKKYYISHSEKYSPLKLAYEYHRMAITYSNQDIIADNVHKNHDMALKLAVSSHWELTNENIIDFSYICRSAFTHDRLIVAKYGPEIKNIIDAISSFEGMSEDCAHKMALLMETIGNIPAARKYLNMHYSIVSADNSDSENIIRALSLLRNFEREHGTDEAYREYTFKLIEFHKQTVEKHKSSSAAESVRLAETARHRNAIGNLYYELHDGGNAFLHYRNAFESALQLTKAYPSRDNYYLLSSCARKTADVLERYRKRERADDIKRLKELEIECSRRIIAPFEEASSLPEKVRLYELLMGYKTISSKYVSINDYDNAVVYGHKALDAAQKHFEITKDLFSLYNAYYHLSRMYNLNDDYKSAFEYKLKGFEYEKTELTQINSRENQNRIAYRTQRLGEYAFKAKDDENGEKYFMESARLRAAIYNEYKDEKAAAALYYTLYDLRRLVKDQKTADNLKLKMDEIKKYWPDI